jgi:rhodanese-related sulfurtransferase
MNDLLANAEITPQEVKQLQSRGENFRSVDVREPWEYNMTRIEGSTFIAFGQIPANLAHLEPADSVVLFCHHGRRGLDAAAWLRSQGVEEARSMAGGIGRRSTEIDPRVPRYGKN